MERLTSLALTRDGKYLVSGGERGFVVVRETYSLEVVKRFPAVDAAIRSLCLTAKEDMACVGLADGRCAFLGLNWSEYGDGQGLLTSQMAK